MRTRPLRSSAEAAKGRRNPKRKTRVKRVFKAVDFVDKLLTFSISSKKFLTARESGGSPPLFHTFPPWLILRGATFSTASLKNASIFEKRCGPLHRTAQSKMLRRTFAA